MALTELQRRICRLIAATRVTNGERYVAGGVALNELIGTPRVSRDIDLFHDTEAAVAASWAADRTLLASAGYDVVVLHERRGRVEARVSQGTETVLIEWARDSAFRFFPLVEHAELGLVLHPFDLATNKVLALIGRLEVRDWIDLIECDRRVQPLGLLAWAAPGKDPGFSPASILSEASRTARYSKDEVAALAFDGAAPDAGDLSRAWHSMLDVARRVIALLPAEAAGTCVLGNDGRLIRGDEAALSVAIAQGGIRFHPGSIGGALPQIVSPA